MTIITLRPIVFVLVATVLVAVGAACAPLVMEGADTCDRPETPEGMVYIPGGSFDMGAGEKERALWKRTVEEFTSAARAQLRQHPRTAQAADADDLDAAIEQLSSAISGEVQQARNDLATAERLLEAHSDDKYLITRLGTLKAFIARQEAGLAQLRLAQARVDYARSMQRWKVHETPPVRVTVRPFYMDANLVTVAEYRAFCEATGRDMPWPYQAARDHAAGRPVELRGHPRELFPEAAHPSFMDDHSPIAGVSYEDAMAYAEWAGKRLPTEQEWEWAARGGLNNPLYPWGDEPWDGSQANLGSKHLLAINPTNPNHVRIEHVTIDDGHTALAPVGSYPPNGYGLYDMAGNLMQWCSASPCFDPHLLARLAGEDVPELRADIPRRWGIPSGNFQPIRGSAYTQSAFEARLTRRYGPPANHNHADRGIRCVRDVE